MGIETKLNERHELAEDGPELALVIPTFNEAENIEALVELLRPVLEGVRYEIIFVDDCSADGTAALVRRLGRRDPRIRCIMRIGRRGLAGAVIEGVLSTNAEYFAVMDADLQHDETLLPRMLHLLRERRADLVIASRYMEGGGTGAWSSSRAAVSRLATRASRLILRQAVSDPMSGYFMGRCQLVEQAAPHLSSEGYKILFDLLVSAKGSLACIEVPYTFRPRQHGSSKLDAMAAWSFLVLIADKLVGHIVPPRFVLFALVGTIGLIIHFAVLTTLFKLMSIPFSISQTTATLSAMAGNFTFNNLLTYRDRRLRGWRWWTGLFSFSLICSVGALSNVGIASVLFERQYDWWLAALAGVLVGTVFNFSMTSLFTWGQTRK